MRPACATARADFSARAKAGGRERWQSNPSRERRISTDGSQSVLRSDSSAGHAYVTCAGAVPRLITQPATNHHILLTRAYRQDAGRAVLDLVKRGALPGLAIVKGSRKPVLYRRKRPCDDQPDE
jgi:hypothetical protein